MASEVLTVTVRDLVLWLTALEEDHLDHGRRLQAEGVRGAIVGIQKKLQVPAIEVDGTSDLAGTAGTPAGLLRGKPGSP